MNRRITSILGEIDIINNINSKIDKSVEWKLIGYWPIIMKSVHHIDLNMDLIFKKEPIQSYLNAYIYNNIRSSKKKAEISQSMKAVRIGQTKLL